VTISPNSMTNVKKRTESYRNLCPTWNRYKTWWSM